ncbi:site-specific integrase [Tellurirhabdus rosea]|uniref:site-specific integrase n=1 Tax=Tellurirhabdus rosea TaxID=2674997 RepID=UPI00225496BE|nr:site-specific integrase [Tellurirhabdus rosea]
MSKKSAPQPLVATAANTSLLTVTELIAAFEDWLPRPGNYPRIARRYVDYCLEHRLRPDRDTLAIYSAGKPGNLVSPLRKFLLFYQMQGQPELIPDPNASKAVAPVALNLINKYIEEATHLQGTNSKVNYIKSLKAFFRYLQREQAAGRKALFSGESVSRYMVFLQDSGKSAYTVNLYLSTVKQLADWVIRNRDALKLKDENVADLQAIQQLRSLPVPRKPKQELVEA